MFLILTAQQALPPSLLTIILDTNPHAWSLLDSTLPLTTAIANILVFINAHLAINYANRVAVIASHVERAQFLYPTPDLPTSDPYTKSNDNQYQNGRHVEMSNADQATGERSGDANKYRPFAQIEHAITTNLRHLIDSTTPQDLESSTSTMMAGALTLALSYIAKQSLNAPTAAAAGGSYDASNAAGAFTATSADGTSGPSTTGLLSRIMIISISGDLAQQYIPIMNSIFACQRLTIPIDILTLSPYSSAEFLQQAADATGGIYIDLGGSSSPDAQSANGKDQTNGSTVEDSKSNRSSRVAGLLQTLMMAYLPDQSARQWLIQPGESEGVDFRAACFCHGTVVDLGWVCSICLSSKSHSKTLLPIASPRLTSTVFCAPPPDQTCLTCGSYLALSNYGKTPVVVPPKKKLKKKRLGNLGVSSAAGTPSRAETPASDYAVTPTPAPH